MTTYLVALVVSDFVCKYGVAQPVLSKSVNISVCGRTSAADQLDYSVDISIKALETLESLYQVAYPLGKSGRDWTSCLTLTDTGIKQFLF